MRRSLVFWVLLVGPMAGCLQPSGVAQLDRSPAEANTTQANTTQANTTQANTTQANTTQANTTQANSSPTEASPPQAAEEPTSAPTKVPQEVTTQPAVRVDQGVGRAAPFDIPSLAGADAAEGLAYAGNVLVYVPEDVPGPFKVHFEADKTITIERDGQPRQTIAASVDFNYVDGERVLVNPLADLSPEGISDLWGLYLAGWSDEIAEQCRHISPETTAITLHGHSALKDSHGLPPISKRTRYLHVQSGSNSVGIGAFGDFSLLADLRELRHLSMSPLGAVPFDLSLLSQANNLSELHVAGRALKGIETLGKLSELRELNLANCEEVEDLAFASSMPSLRALNISRTPVSDLTPLSGLKDLVYINADSTTASRLPEATPALRTLRLLSTRVPHEAVVDFASRHPDCAILRSWTGSLKNALATATRVVIRSGGTCHRNVSAEKTHFETDDPKVIAELMSAIDINEQHSFHCMCCGDPSFDFYKGDELVAMLGFHHGKSLRWVGGWPGDGMLAAESAPRLIRWLADHNVSGPQDQVDAELARQRAFEDLVNRAIGHLSPTLQTKFRGLLSRASIFMMPGRAPKKHPLVAAVESELSDAQQQIAALLRILGTSNDSWSSSGPVEQLADSALKTYDVDALGLAVQSALLGDNRQTRRGAARFWFGWQSSLEAWQPENLSELRAIVITIQQESPYYPLRQRALNSLARWRADLASEDFAERVRRGLRDPHPSVRRSAMLCVGTSGFDGASEDLMTVLRGGSLDPIPLPVIPEEEATGVSEGFDNVAGKRAEDEVAALALGYLQHEEARSVIAAKEKESPMFAVALALLGETERLQSEHFAIGERNTELQLAAVEAVVRCRGEHGLQHAVNYRQSTMWWEREYVARRLSQMLLSQQAPGDELLRDAKKMDQLVEWFEKFGDDYLSRFRESE